MSTINRSPTTALLAAGQRLRQAEFHERYEAMPPGTRAELIGGVVVMPSPVGRRHSIVSGDVIAWLNFYRCRTPGLQVGDNATIVLDDLGEPQPDASLWVLAEYGGQARAEDDLIRGAPELVAEVAGSSRSIDLGEKRIDYERTGVKEYLVFALDPDEFFGHVRAGARLERVALDPDGIFRSRVFPGLWLDPQALFDDDLSRIIATLDQGMATPEHAAFVAELRARRERS